MSAPTPSPIFGRCPVCHRRLPEGKPCPIDGASAAAPIAEEHAPLPSLPGRWVQEGVLGAGGAGVVFAVRLQDGSSAALKLGAPSARERYAREAAALRALGAPVTPALFEDGEHQGHPYLLMERLRGLPLSAVLARVPGKGSVPILDALDLMGRLSLAVASAHARRLVHRDLKPENLFLRADGSVVLLDFGLVTSTETREGLAITQPGQRVGTAHYMAPELCTGAAGIGPAVDVYALGVILYELISGRPPFVGERTAIYEGHLTLKVPALPVPEEVRALLAKCLAKEAGRRFDDAQALSAAIARVTQRLPPLGSVEPVPVQLEPVARVTPSVPVQLESVESVTSVQLEPVERATASVQLEPVERATASVQLEPVERTTASVQLESVESAPSSIQLEPIERATAPVHLEPVERATAFVQLEPVERATASVPLEPVEGATASVQLEPVESVTASVQLEPVARVTSSVPVQLAPLESVTPRHARGERGTRRMALLGVVVQGAITQVAALVSADGGTLARWEGPRCVIAFPEHLSVREGARAALRTGRSLLSSGRATGAVLHVAEIFVYPGRAGPRLLGEALEQASTWMATHESGWVFTPEAEATLGRDAQNLKDLSLTPARAPVAAPSRPLQGRAFELAALETSAAQTTVPTLMLVHGAAGIGKSRLMSELAARTPDAVLLLAPSPDVSEETTQAFERALTEALTGPRVFIDEGQWLSSRAAAAIERATLSGQSRATWVALAARPELLALRPHFGERAGRCERLELHPLPSDAARALLLAELGSGEFVPAPVLERLAQLTRGNPLAIVELTRSLRETETLRADPRTGEWQLAADQLGADPVTPLFERSAQHALGLLPPPSLSLAFLCATLGEEVSVPLLDGVTARLDPSHEALCALDLGEGLKRLVRGGLLETGPGGQLRFRHPQLRKAVEAAAPFALAQAFHRAAFEALGGAVCASPEGLPRWTHHAASCGAHEEAAFGHLTLAERARGAHRDTEAEQHYTQALRHLPAESARDRETALEGRGRVRGRSQRYAEAREDLAEARHLARARGDAGAEVELWLQEATACDWSEDAAGCDLAVEAALALASQVEAPQTRLRCELARARKCVRAGSWPEAVETLGRVVEEADARGDSETELVARVLLGSALTFLGDEARSEACFEEAIDRSRARGDELHLAAATINRVLLWIRRSAVDLAMGDLRQTMDVARSLGHAQLERWASGNTAELLHWSGRPAEALPLAERAHALGQRFFSTSPVATDALLLARVHAALGEWQAAEGQLAWIATCVEVARLTPTAVIQMRYVHLLRREAGGAPVSVADRRSLLAAAEARATDDELLELLVEAVPWARKNGHPTEAQAWLAQAQARAERAPLWRARVSSLGNGAAVASKATERAPA